MGFTQTNVIARITLEVVLIPHVTACSEAEWLQNLFMKEYVII